MRECGEQILLDKRLKILKGCYKVTIHSGRAGSVGHGGFALFCNAIGPKTSTTFFFFFFNRSDANLNQVWLYLFLFTQFASFYFEFSVARWDIYFLLIGSIKMHCNGRGFNNWGGGDCRWSPVARRPWIWILQVVSCDLEFRLLSVQALFLMPRILKIAFSRLYLCVYILFFGGGGYEPFPPPFRKKEPYILFLNLFCYTVGSRVLKVLLKPQSNKLICNRKKLVDKKIVFIINIIIVFHFRHRKSQGLFYSSAIPAWYKLPERHGQKHSWRIWFVSENYHIIQILGFFFYFNIQWHWLPPEKLKKSWILNS